MPSSTTILTRHDVTVNGSDLSASMMLDDTGEGHVMVSTNAGPSFSMDAAKIAPMMQLLAECEAIRRKLHQGPELTPAAFGSDRP
jgi:hypothetical protein